MERYNSEGKFNVPFGHYKKMSCNLSPDHHNFFSKKATIYNRDAIDIIDECTEDDWYLVNQIREKGICEGTELKGNIPGPK